MSKLEEGRCVPCEGGVKPLNPEAVKKLLTQLDDWELNGEATEISRRFRFRNHYQTIAFVNAVAWVSHREDHHPAMEVGYNTCTVRYSTHAIDGLSNNDFICAAKLDALTIPTESH